ncbi:MAG: hypothetical protein ACFFD9_06940 [Candidatus Thorarchaeota archaeon]
MADHSKLTLREFHEKMAKQTNGGIWTVLDNDRSTAREMEEALELAYTSRYHWKQVGTLTNDVRALYMISRVLAHMKKGESALQYANDMLKLAKKAETEDSKNWKNFDMPFVYEALAKAHAADGNENDCLKYKRMSQDLIDKLTNEQDKRICQGELDKISC